MKKSSNFSQSQLSLRDEDLEYVCTLDAISKSFNLQFHLHFNFKTLSNSIMFGMFGWSLHNLTFKNRPCHNAKWGKWCNLTNVGIKYGEYILFRVLKFIVIFILQLHVTCEIHVDIEFE